MNSPHSLPTDRSIILFDGVCNLCNEAVTFVIERDPKDLFRFAALQGSAAASILQGSQEEVPNSILLVENGRIYSRSDAALRIALRLKGAYPLLYTLRLLPRWFRDRIYDWVARNRYGWFGKRDACMIPTAELRAKFLE